MSKDRIEYSESGQLSVPNTVTVPFIIGDGTGQDIWEATRGVLEAALFQAYGNAKAIKWLEVLAGEKAYRQTSEWLPSETIEKIREYRIAIKGPLTTPVGKGFRSVNVALRQELDLYACVRPVKYIPGVPAPLRYPEDVDMVVFRENTEDVYAGFEWQADSPMAEKLIDFIRKEDGREIRAHSAIGVKPMSRFGTARLVRSAVRYALDHKRKSVTLVHKGNIMKYTEGAFVQWGYETIKEEFANHFITEKDLEALPEKKTEEGKIVIKDRIADAMFQQILLRPSEYDVLAMPNLNGDYMSDALAATVGGLGLAPGANIGDGCAVFEATHGTAPKYAGQDKVNPSSLILSGSMLFDYLGWPEAAMVVRNALNQTIHHKTVTYDLARQMKDAKEVKCSEFARLIVKNFLPPH